MGMLISNEPDFMIHGVLKYQLFGQDFWITTTTIGMWIITALILILAVLANRTLKKATDQPGTFQNVLEMAYEALQGMTAGILGGNARRFINYIGTIFVFILFCNRLWRYFPAWYVYLLHCKLPGHQEQGRKTFYQPV